MLSVANKNGPRSKRVLYLSLFVRGTCMFVRCVRVTERDLLFKPRTGPDWMAPKSRHRKRPSATKSNLLKASGAHRGGHGGPSCAHTTERRPSGLRALCGTQNALEEFVACHDACAIRTAASPLSAFAVVHYVRCCSELSVADAARVASRAAIAKLQTVALSANWGEAGYRLSALLVERYARHANSVSSAFFEGRCSLAMLVDTLDRLSRFKGWTAMMDDELGIPDSVVPDLLAPWFGTDPSHVATGCRRPGIQNCNAVRIDVLGD